MLNSSTCSRRSFFAFVISVVFAISCMFPFAANAQTSASVAVSNSAAPLTQTLKDAHMKVFTDDSMAGEFYFAQSGSGRCTIASTAMMVRRAAYLDGMNDWQVIDEAFVAEDGWTSAGVKNEFTTAGYSISYSSIEPTKESLIALLEEHPEGIAAYDSGVPHAVLLTDYDATTDTFYCADPANYYSGSRIPVDQSWNGERHGHDQDAVIAGFTSAWIID